LSTGIFLVLGFLYCIRENTVLIKNMRKPFLLFLISASFLLFTGYSYGFESRDQDCSKCHTLDQNEARELLKDLIPNLKILQIRGTPPKGLWEVFIESGGRKNLIYIDFAKRHVFSGTLISIRDRRNLTQESFGELNRVDVSQIPLDDALVMGEKTAKYKVIVFDDPD